MRFFYLAASLAVAAALIVAMLRKEPPHIAAIAFREDGIEALGYDLALHYLNWSLKEQRSEPISLPGKAIPLLCAAALSCDGSQIALADPSRIYQGSVGGPLHETLHLNGIVSGLAVSPDGNLVAALNTKHEIYIFLDGKVQRVISGRPDRFSVVQFAPDLRTLAVGLSNLDRHGPTIQLYKVETGALIKTFGPIGCLTALAFSPDGKSLVTSMGLGQSTQDPSVLTVLKVKDGSTVAAWKDSRLGRPFHSLAFDGARIVATPGSGDLQMFRLDEHGIKPIRTGKGVRNH